MCLGAMSEGVRDARWTQIDAIERVNVPWKPVEWRLPCQMNCRKAIVVPDELQESEGPCTNRALRAVRGRSVAGRGSSCKPSRERMCLGAMSEGVHDARWTQIDAIARVNVPWKPVEWRLPCQMNCRRAEGRALTGL